MSSIHDESVADALWKLEVSAVGYMRGMGHSDEGDANNHRLALVRSYIAALEAKPTPTDESHTEFTTLIERDIAGTPHYLMNHATKRKWTPVPTEADRFDHWPTAAMTARTLTALGEPCTHVEHGFMSRAALEAKPTPTDDVTRYGAIFEADSKTPEFAAELKVLAREHDGVLAWARCHMTMTDDTECVRATDDDDGPGCGECLRQTLAALANITAALARLAEYERTVTPTELMAYPVAIRSPLIKAHADLIAAQERYERLAQAATTLADIAEFEVDPDECSFDHNGFCQVHGCGDMGDRDVPHCPTAALKEQIAVFRAALSPDPKEDTNE